MRGRGKREADQKWMQIAVIIFIIVVVFFSTELFWSLFKQRKEEKEGSSLKLRVAQWDDVRKWIYRQIKFCLSRGTHTLLPSYLISPWDCTKRWQVVCVIFVQVTQPTHRRFVTPSTPTLSPRFLTALPPPLSRVRY